MRCIVLSIALVGLFGNQSMSGDKAVSHLEPCAIRCGESADYVHWLQESLMTREDGSCLKGLELDMLFFNTEHCGEMYVAVLMDDSEIEGVDVTVFHAWADEPLYYVLRDYRKDHPLFGIYPDVKIERVEVEFPSKTARDILRLWRETLFSTRYSPTYDPILDGVTYLFTAVDKEGRRLYGETPGYESGDTARLIGISKLLMKYCKASEKCRNDILAKLKLLIVQDAVSADAVKNSMEGGGSSQLRQQRLEEIRKQMDETILKQRERDKESNSKE